MKNKFKEMVINLISEKFDNLGETAMQREIGLICDNSSKTINVLILEIEQEVVQQSKEMAMKEFDYDKFIDTISKLKRLKNLRDNAIISLYNTEINLEIRKKTFDELINYLILEELDQEQRRHEIRIYSQEEKTLEKLVDAVEDRIAKESQKMSMEEFDDEKLIEIQSLLNEFNEIRNDTIHCYYEILSGNIAQ